jgi:hypothetical protein
MSDPSASSTRSPFAGSVPHDGKRSRGSTPAARTPLTIRTSRTGVSNELDAYVHERMGYKLGKYARHIASVTVRFEDVNGPRKGVDTACRINVVLSGHPRIVVEDLQVGAREAFDRCADGTERAVRRAIERDRRRGLTTSPSQNKVTGWR